MSEPISSAILKEICEAAKIDMPTSLKGISSMMKVIVKLTGKDALNSLSDAAQDYVKECTKAARVNGTIPVPNDFVENVPPKPEKRPTKKAIQENLMLEVFECSCTTKVVNIKSYLDMRE